MRQTVEMSGRSTVRGTGIQFGQAMMKMKWNLCCKQSRINKILLDSCADQICVCILILYVYIYKLTRKHGLANCPSTLECWGIHLWALPECPEEFGWSRGRGRGSGIIIIGATAQQRHFACLISNFVSYCYSHLLTSIGFLQITGIFFTFFVVQSHGLVTEDEISDLEEEEAEELPESVPDFEDLQKHVHAEKRAFLVEKDDKKWLLLCPAKDLQYEVPYPDPVLQVVEHNDEYAIVMDSASKAKGTKSQWVHQIFASRKAKPITEEEFLSRCQRLLVDISKESSKHSTLDSVYQ